MNKIILLSLCIFCLCISGFSQDAKNQPISVKMIEAIKRDLPDWKISQNPELANEGIRNNPKFEFKLEDRLKRKVSISVSVVDEKEKQSYFENYSRRAITPRDSNTIENFVDKGFMYGTGDDVEARFSKANLIIDVDLRFVSKRKNFKIPAYELFAPSEEKQKLLKIVETIAKTVDGNVNLDDCSNTFFRYSLPPGATEETKLLAASVSGDSESVSELLRRNVNPNTRVTQNTDSAPLSHFGGYTALHYAAKQGCGKTVRALIAGKADLNAANERGETPLMLAASHNNLEVLRLLLAANADLQAESFGRNAAFFVLRGEQTVSVYDYRAEGRIQKITENARIMLNEFAAKGLDLKKKDSRDGNTLLAELLSNSSGNFAFETAQFLLASGVDPNEANNNGETPLLKACRLGMDGIKIMKLLISQGADVNKSDKNGQTALTVLMKRQIEFKNDAKYSEIIKEGIQLLKDSGAKD